MIRMQGRLGRVPTERELASDLGCSLLEFCCTTPVQENTVSPGRELLRCKKTDAVSRTRDENCFAHD